MSTNIDGVVPDYRKEGGAEAIDKKRKALEQQKTAKKVDHTGSVKEARELLAAEEQPGVDLPQPEAKTVDWRGSPLEFSEMGSALVDIIKLEEQDKNAEMMEYVTDMLGVKCRNPAADKDYWRQFDLTSGDDDPDSLMELFQKLTGGDLSPEEREQIEEFRNRK